MRRVPDSRSGSTPLFGADGYEELSEAGAAERLGLPAEVVAHLAGRFGGHARAVAAMVRALSLPAYHVTEALDLIARLQPEATRSRRRAGDQ